MYHNVQIIHRFGYTYYMVTYVRLHELYTGLYHNFTVYIYYMYKTKFYTPDGATNSARPVITLG